MHRFSSVHPMLRTPTYLSYSSYHLPNLKFPSILRSSTLVISPVWPAAAHSSPPAAPMSRPLAARKSTLPAPPIPHSSPPAAQQTSPPVATKSSLPAPHTSLKLDGCSADKPAGHAIHPQVEGREGGKMDGSRPSSSLQCLLQPQSLLQGSTMAPLAA